MRPSLSCLTSIPPSPSQASSGSSATPLIALINGLSGGHKGEKVQRRLKKNNIHAFDLLLLSTDDSYFDSFISKLVEIYNSLILEELHSIKQKTNENFQLHPRILIGGGDGSIAWAFSILDRALSDSQILRLFWRRSQIIDDISKNYDDDTVQSNIKWQLSVNSEISHDFYYGSNHSRDEEQLIGDITLSSSHNRNSTNTLVLTPCLNGINGTISTVFDFAANENYIQPLPQTEANVIVACGDNEETLCILPDLLKTDEDTMQCPSSASLSEQDEVRMIEDFMNENTQKTKEEAKYNDSLSESIVTHEELLSIRRQKKSAAVDGNKKSIQDLRILQGIYDSRIAPAVALIPLGTGNDLSRCLGTGFAYPGSKELIQHLLSQYTKAPLTKLDRWKIQFLESDKQSIKNRQTSEMLCYFSVGYEGQVAYKFAQARSRNPKLFDRPWKNKMQYLLSGIGTGMEEVFRITKPLNDVIECYVDGKKLKLPSNTRSLVISNIQSMADGVYFWGKGPNTKKDIKDYSAPMLGDGKLEVMAAKGLYKYLQTRVGISHYRRLAQPKKVTIVMKTELPIQVDGESWIESQGVVHMYLLHQVFAVVGKNEARGVQII